MISRGSICVLACALLLSLGACSSDDVGSADPGGGPGHSSSDGTGGTPSAPASSASSGSTAASAPVQPATGPLVKLDAATYRLPAGVKWTLIDGGLTAGVFEGTLESAFFASDDYGDDLDEMASVAIRSYRLDKREVERLPDREVQGRTVFVVAAEDKAGYVVRFGWTDGKDGMRLDFQTDKRTARTDQWVESVLASIVWK